MRVTHGLPLGHEDRPRALGVLAAAVLIVSLVVTGRVQFGTGGGRSVHVDGFEATAAPHRVGGDDPVPLPAGVRELGGVSLVPASGRLRRQCRPAADRLGFAVPCPTLLPAPSPGAAPPTLCDPRYLCGPEVGFLFEEDGFMAPRGHAGVDAQPRGRLAVAVARQVTAFPVACLGGRTVARTRVHGLRGGLFECPSEAGAHFGGVLLRWRERGVVVAVSLHGHTELNRRLVMVLAAHVKLVPPSGPP